jgi:hypothetical protein
LGWEFAGGVVGGFVLAGGEADAVDGGVGVADGAESLVEGEMAAAVEGLADEENGAAIFGGLVAEEVDGEAEAVEDRGAVVAEAEVVDGERRGAVVEVVLTRAAGGEGADGVGGGVGVGGEVLEEGGLAVEGDTATLWGTLPMIDSSMGARGGAMAGNLLNSRAPAPPISMTTTRARGSPPVSCSRVSFWGMPSSVRTKSFAVRV